MSQGQPKQMNFGRGPRMGGPAEKAKNQRETLSRVWHYVKQQKIGLFFSIFFVIASTFLSLAGPYMIGHIIDDYIMKKDIDGTIRLGILLAVIFSVASILTWLQTYVMIQVAMKTIRTLRLELFQKLQTLTLRFFDQRALGDLMSRVTNDIDNLNTALVQSVTQIVSSILTVIGVSIAMFTLSWQLAIVTLIIIPLIVFTTKQIIKRSSKNYAARQRDLGKLNGYIEEMITGSEVLTLFGREQQTIDTFHQQNENLRNSAQRAEITSGLLGPINNFMNNLGLAIVIGTGAFLAVKSIVTVGIIAAFVTYTRQFFRPLNQLSNLLNTFQSAIAGAERVFEILDEPSEVADKPNAIKTASLKGDVVFKQVSFSYEPNKPVLKNIDFHAKAGETFALVGPTGSGKTTIINLLTRFYDVDQGEILIDGHNIEHYQMATIRQRVGVVLQDTYLFSGTIRENIRFGKLDATDEEVVEAAKIANAHHFIKYLPAQYETPVQAGGANLSQGQRQLIAIARAILENADILILDEATSSVDTQTEVDIQKGLQHLMQGRTSFVIAHRLKTIENADQILVIQQGEIVEQGNHQELMQQQGIYRHLQQKLLLEQVE
ncbi:MULTISPECIES: ABC transporter ATP-binding protein [Lysinibacillus]|uniref:ABC transporter ATP-binding protein n=1 Tax=Lysinibacillus TaxID=400634 RepID=UPI0021538154|nr:ABC transporter ATP-binding protein [Lysinibacillus capsici]MCR6522569.1 ABC transporter ATP-binding protein/permease [Lysinibacillus capsici]MCT1539160.1 ABC transporter ATP-binding protein/permease [Lysinibacillus capsici]MCT1569623.1 ABC transporter ATP-binding protein/permease [Lysinibacillus capsici]MCT1647081.1 ABC transporter ATP-binding protein/permease [Lysinibacillus capsici]MCT1725622.1 ABC transporter ATP-binding protein/permease [Lysinibacillus capsici]